LVNHKTELPMAAINILYRLRGFRGEGYGLWRPCLLNESKRSGKS